MKKVLFLALMMVSLLAVFNVSAQDKSKRPSPPDTVKALLPNGVNMQIAYSQPSIKGRTIGNDIAPYGKVWRLGANEATTIELSKDVKIEGKSLPAGKYGVYAIPGQKDWVFIFNSVWKIWGLKYTQDEIAGAKTDVLRITVSAEAAPEFTEKMKFFVDTSGKVYFVWGNVKAGFKVK